MYLITNKERMFEDGTLHGNEVLMWDIEVDYLMNGYPRLVNKNTAFPREMVNVIVLDSIPDEVKEMKYCYTKKQGFYLNPDWSEQSKYGIPNDLLEQIKQDQINEITKGVSVQ